MRARCVGGKEADRVRCGVGIRAGGGGGGGIRRSPLQREDEGDGVGGVHIRPDKDEPRRQLG